MKHIALFTFLIGLSSALPVMAQTMDDAVNPTSTGPDVESGSRIRRPKPAAPPSPLQFVIPAPTPNSAGTPSATSQATDNPSQNSAPNP